MVNKRERYFQKAIRVSGKLLSGRQPVYRCVLLIAFALIAVSCQKTRIEKGYHPNGNLMYEIAYKGSMKNGKSVYYFQDGRKEIEYMYDDDLLEGKVTRWYFNGNIEYEENYRNNKLDGQSRHYYLGGSLAEEKNYKNGELHGDYKVYWENGAQKIAGSYFNGLYHGEWEYFNEQGIRVGEAIFNQGSGKMTGYHRSGRISREVNYKENLKHGLEKAWNENGDITEELYYENGEVVTEVKRN